MRKPLLLLFLIPVLAWGQQVEKEVRDIKATATARGIGESTVKSPVVINPGNLPSAPVDGVAKEFLFREVELGTTTYDLQVNSALANRIILHDDGSVSTVFTYANDGAPFVTRGTGYAHFDGKEWTEAPTKRLEDMRAGWANVGVVTVDGKEREFIVSHHANQTTGQPSGGLFVMMNDEVGSTDFSIVERLEVAEDGPFWPRAIGQGSYIHIFCAANTSADEEIEGILRPNSYYRYDAGTSKWLDEQVLLPGYDSTRIASGRSDAYIMDATETAVAIVSGGSGQDLFLWKTTNNGDDWDVTVIDSFPIPAWVGNDDFIDTFETNSGSVGLILDDEDVAHVFYNRNRVTEDDALADSTWSFFPGTNGIVYWNEKQPDSLNVIAGMPDLDDDGTLTFFQDQTTLVNGARYGNNTIACFPSAGIDGDGTIYLAYSAPTETQVSPDGPLYRDIFMIYSEDGGESWSDPQTLVDNYSEDVFGHIARTVTDKVHVMWQRDEYPGDNVQNEHPETINKIMYAAVDVSLIKDEKLKPLRSDIEGPEVVNFKVSAPYPNPANERVVFDLELISSDNMTVDVKNLLGQTIITHRLGNMSAGAHKIELETASLQSGVYIYTIQSNESTLSGELIIE